jgi:hypothetical protein
LQLFKIYAWILKYKILRRAWFIFHSIRLILSRRKYIWLVLNVFFLSHELCWTLLTVERSNIGKIPHVLILFNRPNWVVDITFVLCILQRRWIHAVIFSFRASEFNIHLCLVDNLVFILLDRGYLLLFVLIVDQLFSISLLWFVACAIKHSSVKAHLDLWGAFFYFYILHSWLFEIFKIFF